VPTGGAPALQCLEKEQGETLGRLRESRLRRQRRWRASGCPAAGAAPAAGGSGGSRCTGGAAVIVLRPMRPREELFVLRSACGADVRSICGGVQPGGGRIVQCLATNAASFRRPARTCCPSSRRDDHIAPAAVLHRSGDRRSLRRRERRG
jgi:hypothetical protein